MEETEMEMAFSEIQSMINAHRTALQRMVTNGVSITNICASTPLSQNPFACPACLTDECHLYRPNGGGISYYTFKKLHPSLAGTSSSEFLTGFLSKVSVAYKGSETNDLVYRLSVTEKFCNFINQELGFSTPIASTTPASYAVFQINTNPITLSSFQHIYSLGSTGQAPHLYGKDEICFRTVGGEYVFYSLIYAN